MSEDSKTILFLAIAFVSTLVAMVVSREAPEKTGADEVGKPFVAIKNPLDVTGMKIVKFDTNEGQAEPFEVNKVDGRFSIPSHENYPADERDHLVSAVAGVNHAEILSSVTNRSGNHPDFGVLDPTDDQLGKGVEGVGTRVTLSDAEGKTLTDFIIGKMVRTADGQYYVRQAGNDQVYTVKLQPESLSTQFEDWIERDLLKLDPLELQDVSINDYTVITQQQPVLGNDGLQVVTVVQGVDMQSDIQLQYDQNDLEWKLKQLVVFQKGLPKEEKLTADQELNKKRLDEMKSALDDLKIVNVYRKPAGLGDSLAEFIRTNPQATESLEEHGFFFRTVQAPSGEKQSVLLSNNGEVKVGMADGVEYVLRFGNVAGKDKAAGKNESPADELAGVSSEGGKVLRNLMVVTRFDERLIEKPDYQEIPAENPPEPARKEGEETEASARDLTKSSATKSRLAEDDAPQTPGESGKNLGAPDSEGAQKKQGALTAGEKDVEAEAAKKSWQEKRERIIKDNERKKKDYDEKVTTGKMRSTELNRRFADWYYVISDEIYQKIHLTSKDVIQEKEKPKESPDGATSPLRGKRDPLDQLRDIVPPVKP